MIYRIYALQETPLCSTNEESSTSASFSLERNRNKNVVARGFVRYRRHHLLNVCKYEVTVLTRAGRGSGGSGGSEGGSVLRTCSLPDKQFPLNLNRPSEQQHCALGENEPRKPATKNTVISFTDPLICIVAVMGDVVIEKFATLRNVENRRVLLQPVSMDCQEFSEAERDEQRKREPYLSS